MLDQQPEASLAWCSDIFHASWPKGGSPPADEPGQDGGIATANVPNNSTGVGKKIQFQTDEVERDFGKLRSAISVR